MSVVVSDEDPTGRAPATIDHEPGGAPGAVYGVDILNRMRPQPIIVERAEFSGGIAATVHDGETHHVWIASPSIPSVPSDDLTPWLIALLPYAMRKGATLQMRGAVDAELYGHLDAIQDKLARWYPKRLRVIDVEVEKQITSERSAARAAFFSGGVDSFYTLATASPNVDAVIFVGGFDIPVDQPERIERAAKAVRQAASEFGAFAIEVNTNLRSLTDPVTSWGYEQHGASLAAVSYALHVHAGTVQIASSYSDDDLHPWGSHPDLDPLWSSSAQAIVHDSTVELRVEKVAAIMPYESARQGLRVCWMNTDEYNCGTCEKCVRTRINLRATGNDGACATLPKLELVEVYAMRLADDGARLFGEESLRFLRSSDVSDADLENALEDAINRGTRRGQLIKTLDKVPGLRATYRVAKRALGR